MIGLVVWLMRTIPGSFLPPEDQGYLLGAVIMPDAASLDRTEETCRSKATEYLRQGSGASAAWRLVDGFSLLDNQIKNNAAVFFVGFKAFDERYKFGQYPHAERERGHSSTPTQISPRFSEGIILPVNPPSIPGLGTTGGLEMWIQAKGDVNIAQMADAVNGFLAPRRKAAAGARRRMTSTFNAASQQLLVDVDRDKVRDAGRSGRRSV